MSSPNKEVSRNMVQGTHEHSKRESDLWLKYLPLLKFVSCRCHQPCEFIKDPFKLEWKKKASDHIPWFSIASV